MYSALKSVRENLKLLNIDAFIVGSEDCHQSEYVGDTDKRLEFISNFSGSSGTALILATGAYLWTDGRYFLQASQELSSEWTLMKQGSPGVLEMDQWLLSNLTEQMVVGVDGSLITTQQAKNLQSLLSAKKISLVAIDINPIDKVWLDSSSYPHLSCEPIKIHDLKFAGQPYEEKLNACKDFIAKQEVEFMAVSMLDEINWLFNIRGNDIAFNPVVKSYAVIGLHKSYIFIDLNKIPNEETRSHFDPKIIEILPYQEIESFFKRLSEDSKKVLADLSQLNWRLYLALGSNAKDGVSCITLSKSLKNPIEIEGIRQAHIRDGVALTAFLCWLETTVRNAPNSISEYDVTEKIEEFRQKMQYHMGPSFTTIAGYGPNGAIIHYQPAKETAAMLGLDSLFLLDSGAQYLDGTTDVTRTIHFGEVSQRMKDCYTLVLKGHIALARVVFPEGTLGSRLDAMARAPLWAHGLDYNHGTGHGVGAFLNVHEGPQGIGCRRRDTVGFSVGMTTSNEPGYYEESAFGIRIENVCITVEVGTANNFMGKRYCKFQEMTMVPMKTSLVNVDLLNSEEIQWLNQYNESVRRTLIDMMPEYFPEALEYLVRETAAI